MFDVDLFGGEKLDSPKYQESSIIASRFASTRMADSGIVMVDGTFFGDSFEQDRSWYDFGTTISGI